MLKSLLKDKFEEFIFEYDRVIGKTQMIHIRFRDKLYLIGKFTVTLRFNGQILFRNNTNRAGSYDHPHVSEEFACLGNMKEVLPKMIYAGDYLGGLMLCHDFLCNYNDDDPYYKVDEGWRAVKQYDENNNEIPLGSTDETSEEEDELEDDRRLG